MIQENILQPFEIINGSFTLDSNAFKVMIHESSKLSQRIEAIFRSLVDEYGSNSFKGIALFVFGSPKRMELVKYGDIDAFLISPPESYAVRQRIIAELSELPYDKVDIPDWNSLAQVNLASLSNNPEGDYADASFIAGDREVLEKYNRLDISSRFVDINHLLPKIIFHFYFWSLKYNRSSKQGINLKYSHGATRDILFIDWIHDLLTEGESRNNNYSPEPQILKAIRYFTDNGVLNEAESSRALDAINTVTVTKYTSLQLNSETMGKGEGYLNEELATRLLSTEEFRGKFTDIYELAAFYNNARYIIYWLKCKLYDHINNLGLSIDNPHSIDLIHNLWNNRASFDYEQLNNLFNQGLSKNWYVIASTLCRDDVPEDTIHQIANSFVSQSGFEYLTRLMILHKNTSYSTLLFLNSLPTLALAPETELKYRKLLFNRLNGGK